MRSNSLNAVYIQHYCGYTVVCCVAYVCMSNLLPSPFQSHNFLYSFLKERVLTQSIGCRGPEMYMILSYYCPGIESRWGGGRGFPHLSRTTLGTTETPVQYVPSLFRGKERSGRDADPSPLLVPWSRKSITMLLLPLSAVLPVESLISCTRVHFNFTYTSTPPMDRTACTEPQCLYKGAL